MAPLPLTVTALAFVSLCAVSDIRTRRIPNALTASGMLAGLAVNSLSRGAPGFFDSLTGLVLSGLVLLAPFALGGIGGGDVKMMAGVGAIVGARLGITGLAVGMVLGGVVMVVHLARQGRLREKLAATWAMFAVAAAMQSADPLRAPAKDEGAIALPYSVPLGIGTLAALLFAESQRFF
jgi:prepilin peptidase CpaA